MYCWPWAPGWVRSLWIIPELLAEVQGRANTFLQRLRDKKVRGFRGKQISFLEDYFDQKGYLDSRDILPQEDLLLNVLSAVNQELNNEIISVSEIRLLVAAWSESIQ